MHSSLQFILLFEENIYEYHSLTVYPFFLEPERKAGKYKTNLAKLLT